MYVVIAQSDFRSTDNKLTITDILFVVVLGIPITVPPPGKLV